MHISDTRIDELIRAGGEQVLKSQPTWQAALDEATVPLLQPNWDPEGEAAVRRSNTLTIAHLATYMIQSPGEVAPPLVSQEILDYIGDQVRRGTADISLKSYRVGQTVFWHIWLDIVSGLTNNPAEVQAVLHKTLDTTSAFLEDTMAAVSDHIEKERAILVRGTPRSRRELIQAIVEGQDIDPKTASTRLDYRLVSRHQSFVLWSNRDRPDSEPLQKSAKLIESLIQPKSVLRADINSSTLWLWVAAPVAAGILYQAASDDISIAAGPVLNGFDGFVRSHLRAVETQKMLLSSGRKQPVIHYDEVRLASLLLNDQAKFETFAKDALGDLATADEELRNSVLAFIRQGCNLAEAAQTMGIHRNTMTRRIERVEYLLNQPLSANNRLAVAAALEGMRWQGV